jgi:hypothetical protein
MQVPAERESESEQLMPHQRIGVEEGGSGHGVIPSDSESSEPTASSPSYAVSRPAGGTCAGHGTLLPPEPGQPANVIRRHIDVVCQFLHMGRTIGSIESVSTVTATEIVITDSVTYTAANGDQLFASFSGTGAPPLDGFRSYSGTETVTGGTGRFAGATGSFVREGRVNVAAATGEFEISGTISY